MIQKGEKVGARGLEPTTSRIYTQQVGDPTNGDHVVHANLSLEVGSINNLLYVKSQYISSAALMQKSLWGPNKCILTVFYCRQSMRESWY
jgi:hypothetical protein